MEWKHRLALRTLAAATASGSEAALAAATASGSSAAAKLLRRPHRGSGCGRVGGGRVDRSGLWRGSTCCRTSAVPGSAGAGLCGPCGEPLLGWAIGCCRPSGYWGL
ncbi:unnamed protein product [Phaeothamnion confervicola]